MTQPPVASGEAGRTDVTYYVEVYHSINHIQQTANNMGLEMRWIEGD